MQKLICHQCLYLLTLILLIIKSMVRAENLQLQTIGKDRTELILPLRQICVGVPWTNIVWIHVHDNEETSRQVAIETLTQIQQGCLLDLHHNGQREISVNNSNLNYQFDPNRILLLQDVSLL